MELNLKAFKYRIILFIISAVLLFSHLGKIEVNIMEARNFISAREMVQNKEYLLTTLNNEPRYQKPPLPTWLTALSGKIFGFDSTFFMRVPVALITLLLVFIYFNLCKLMGMSEKNSFVYALILITSFYIFFSGRDNQWDMYTHSLMLVCIYFLWKLLTEESYQLRNSIFSGIFFGLSVLSKGPISPYTLFLPFLISYGIVYHIPVKKKWTYYLALLAAGLVTGLSWYVYVRLKDPVYFNAIAKKEAANWNSYEVQPFYYYWSFFLQSGLWALPSLVALWYPYMIRRVKDKKAYTFALIWTLTALVLMSLVPEKKVRYLVPVLIPLAFTTGFYIEYLIGTIKGTVSKKERIFTRLIFGFYALIGVVYPVVTAVLLKKQMSDYLFLYLFSSVALLALAIFIIKGIKSGKYETVFYSMIAMFAVVVITLIPVSKVFFSNPAYLPAVEAHRIAQDEKIKTYRLSDISPELVWNYGEPVPALNQNNNQIVFPLEKRFGLMVADNDSLLIKNGFEGYTLEKKCHIDMYNKKKHSGRLVRDFYIVSRKE